jgi:hypothetical protein
MCEPFATNGATQVTQTTILPSLAAQSNGEWIIPAGWSMGVMPSLSTTGPTQIRAVGIMI